MPTSSIYHDVVIDSDEAAERLLEVLEQSEKWAEGNAEPQCKPRDGLTVSNSIRFKRVDFDHFKT